MATVGRKSIDKAGKKWTINVILPENMKEYIHEKIEQEGWSSAADYIRYIIREKMKEENKI